MGDKTGIGWTDATWNPVTGCTRVSPGCDHCYMFRDWPRWRAMRVPGYEGEPGQVALHEGRLDVPLKWKRPRLIFVCSTSDLFHSAVPFEFIHRVFCAMSEASQHTFQVLTKRPGRMLQFVRWREKTYPDMPSWVLWPDNVWAGTSLEMMEDGKRNLAARLDLLVQVPAKVRWVSAEPLLGDLDFSRWIDPRRKMDRNTRRWVGEGLFNEYQVASMERPPDIHWIVVGGESGPGARPMHPAWVRKVRDQCQQFKVPLFFKQWGVWQPFGYPVIGNAPWTGLEPMDVGPGFPPMAKVGNKSKLAILDGIEYLEFPAGAVARV